MADEPGLVAGLILAAGASARLTVGGSVKANLRWGGRTFLEHGVWNLHDGGCSPIGVVLGAHGLVVPAPALEVWAKDWRGGMRSSLRAGLLALPEGPVLLTHVDRPRVSVDIVKQLVEHHQRSARDGRPALNLVPCYEARNGHPVLLTAQTRARLVEQDDLPLNEVLYATGFEAVEVDDACVLDDVNSPEAYAALLSRYPDGPGRAPGA